MLLRHLHRALLRFSDDFDTLPNSFDVILDLHNAIADLRVNLDGEALIFFLHSIGGDKALPLEVDRLLFIAQRFA